MKFLEAPKLISARKEFRERCVKWLSRQETRSLIVSELVLDNPTDGIVLFSSKKFWNLVWLGYASFLIEDEDLGYLLRFELIEKFQKFDDYHRNIGLSALRSEKVALSWLFFRSSTPRELFGNHLREYEKSFFKLKVRKLRKPKKKQFIRGYRDKGSLRITTSGLRREELEDGLLQLKISLTKQLREIKDSILISPSLNYDKIKTNDLEVRLKEIIIELQKRNEGAFVRL